MKTGITSVYLERYGLIEGAKRMKAHGYDYLDYQNFISTDTEFFTSSEQAFEQQLKEEKKIFDKCGISIYQVHGPWQYPPKDATPEERAVRFDAMAKSIRGAAYLNANAMILHPLMPYGIKTSEHSDEVWQINFEFMSRLCEIAKEYGIILCYENMPMPLFPIHSVSHILDMVKKIHDPHFRVCLDTGHCLICGESPTEAVKMVGKELLGALHVHDNNGIKDLHLPIGQGVGEWTTFADALREIKFDGIFSMETHLAKGDSPKEQEMLEREQANHVRSLVKTI